MAKVSDARKVEVLKSVTFDEYDQQLTIERAVDGTVTVTVRVTDPRLSERGSLRRWAEGIQNDLPGTDMSGLLAELDRRDEAARITYGEHKGEFGKWSNSWWFDREQAHVAESAFGDGSVGYSVTDTVRASLTEAASKGW